MVPKQSKRRSKQYLFSFAWARYQWQVVVWVLVYQRPRWQRESSAKHFYFICDLLATSIKSCNRSLSPSRRDILLIPCKNRCLESPHITNNVISLNYSPCLPVRIDFVIFPHELGWTLSNFHSLHPVQSKSNPLLYALKTIPNSTTLFLLCGLSMSHLKKSIIFDSSRCIRDLY